MKYLPGRSIDKGQLTTLHAAEGGLAATFSTQISYRADPWVNPPTDASLILTVVFDSPVTVLSVNDRWSVSPAVGTVASAFTFTLTPSAHGHALSFNLVGTAVGELVSTASMTLVNGGTSTWAQDTSVASAVLVA